MEEGRKAEGIMKKQYHEKEEHHQVEVNILNDKLEEKGFKLYKVILKNDNIIVEEYTKKLHKRYSDKYKRDGIYYINRI